MGRENTRSQTGVCIVPSLGMNGTDKRMRLFVLELKDLLRI